MLSNAFVHFERKATSQQNADIKLEDAGSEAKDISSTPFFTSGFTCSL